MLSLPLPSLVQDRKVRASLTLGGLRRSTIATSGGSRVGGGPKEFLDMQVACMTNALPAFPALHSPISSAKVAKLRQNPPLFPSVVLGDRSYLGIYPGPCIQVFGQNSSTRAISDLGVSGYPSKLAGGLLASVPRQNDAIQDQPCVPGHPQVHGTLSSVWFWALPTV